MVGNVNDFISLIDKIKNLSPHHSKINILSDHGIQNQT